MTQTSRIFKKHGNAYFIQKLYLIQKLFLSTLFIVAFSCLTPFHQAKAASVPVSPTLTQSVSGLNVTVAWTSVADATDYVLSYAPYPYTGPESIGSIEMGAQTSYSVALWEGAAFLVAIQSRNDQGTSGYSNIETIMVTSPVVSLAGTWAVTGRSGPNSCDEPFGQVRNFNITIEQSGDTLTIHSPSGTAMPTLSGNMITYTKSVQEDGGTTTETLTFNFSEDGTTFSGSESWRWSDGSESCSGASSYAGNRVN